MTKSKTLQTGAMGFGLRVTGTRLVLALGIVSGLGLTARADDTPITLSKMGAFAFGGKSIQDEKGGTQRCDHGYAQFQIPVQPRQYPIVFWHSASTITWESTPDGREGFQSLFLRRGYPVYIIDLPRQGRAGAGCGELTYKPNPGLDQYTFTGWRFGTWDPPAGPEFYPGVQAPTDNAEWLDQVLRARYPESEGEEANARNSAALGSLLEKIGDSVLVTHSGSGVMGFFAATQNEHIKGLVSYEPSAFVFPKGKRPEPVVAGWSGKPQSPGLEVSEAEFAKLKNIKIQMVYADYIPTEPTKLRGTDRRRITLIYARKFAEMVNEIGGDAEVVYLPDLGIKGNTHLLMGDLNNVQIADLFSDFLTKKGLDARK